MNKLTDEAEEQLRAALVTMDQSYSEIHDAIDKVADVIGEQIRFHGAEAVVKWLKTRAPQAHPWRGPYVEKDAFFMDILRQLPGRLGKKTMGRMLSDASEMLKNKEPNL
jgi:hypothetical protein